jgi:hypothetical protein
MLEVLDWFKKDHAAGPQTRPAASGVAFTGLRETEPATALNELAGWLESAGNAVDTRSDAESDSGGDKLSQIHDAGRPHVDALLASYFASAAGTQAARETMWKSLVQYQSKLTQALGVSAETLLAAARKDSSLLPAAATRAAQALAACRTLAKICLVHYSSVPRKLWRYAYAIHARAEKGGGATSPIGLHADHRSHATVEQELLRLLLLQMSAPEMLAPEQIEVADRVVEQLGAEFTLRQPGVCDNPFCFDPAGDAPPRRASAAPAAAGARYFGPGIGYDSLERIYKQLASAKFDDIRLFGKDISPAAQLTAVQHLLTFWRADCSYVPPAHAPARGSLEIVHGFVQVWQQLAQSHTGPRELSIADSYENMQQPPDTWTLRDAGGNELGVELPPQRGAWLKCGALVGVSPRDRGERWVGMIRRMHAGAGGSSHADIAILSREPREVSLRIVLGKHDDSVFTDASSKQFAGHTVHAIILTDGAGGAQPNLLISPTEWKSGRVYELQAKDGVRYLRGMQAARRGDDYVRATFGWLPATA